MSKSAKKLRIWSHLRKKSLMVNFTFCAVEVTLGSYCTVKTKCCFQVKMHRYWPSIEAAMHGPLMIENVTEETVGDFIVREFKVTHTTVSSMA